MIVRKRIFRCLHIVTDYLQLNEGKKFGQNNDHRIHTKKKLFCILKNFLENKG